MCKVLQKHSPVEGEAAGGLDEKGWEAGLILTHPRLKGALWSAHSAHVAV